MHHGFRCSLLTHQEHHVCDVSINHKLPPPMLHTCTQHHLSRSRCDCCPTASTITSSAMFKNCLTHVSCFHTRCLAHLCRCCFNFCSIASTTLISQICRDESRFEVGPSLPVCGAWDHCSSLLGVTGFLHSTHLVVLNSGLF